MPLKVDGASVRQVFRETARNALFAVAPPSFAREVWPVLQMREGPRMPRKGFRPSRLDEKGGKGRHSKQKNAGSPAVLHLYGAPNPDSGLDAPTLIGYIG